MDTKFSEDEPDDVPMTVQDRELADAKRKGLLVDIGDNDKTMDISSPTAVFEIARTHLQEMKELDQWDMTRGNDDFCLDDEDSDDDLL